MEPVHKLKEIHWSNFIIAGLASSPATLVTNPIEVRIFYAFTKA